MSDQGYMYASDCLRLDTAPVKGVRIDIIEYPKDTFAYRLYRENLEDFSDNDKLSIFEWVDQRLKVCKNFSAGRYTVGLEVNDYLPESAQGKKQIDGFK